MYKDDYSPPVVIPHHNKDLKRGTLRNILISMSWVGNPYDNAMAESFMATLKKGLHSSLGLSVAR
ncbi:MAG: hypothetical protein AB1743_03220 [Actinomycetota bacterium]